MSKNSAKNTNRNSLLFQSTRPETEPGLPEWSPWQPSPRGHGHQTSEPATSFRDLDESTMYKGRKVTKNSIFLEKNLFSGCGIILLLNLCLNRVPRRITMDEHWKKRENGEELSFQTENELVTLYIVLQDSWKCSAELLNEQKLEMCPACHTSPQPGKCRKDCADQRLL